MSAVTTLTGSSSAAGRRDGGWERAAPISFWMDDPAAPPPLPALDRPLHTELAVVGGGFSGLWTALLAKQADPGLDVVLLEGERVAWAATGRNGGFCEASLTHGEPNGRNRFPDEYEVLARLGQDNLEAIDAFVRQRRLDCGWERTGTLSVATAAWQVDELRGEGPEPEDWLDTAAVRAEVDSPTYLAGRWDREGGAIVNPARLAWGLRDACLEAGVASSSRPASTAWSGPVGRWPSPPPGGRCWPTAWPSAPMPFPRCSAASGPGSSPSTTTSS